MFTECPPVIKRGHGKSMKIPHLSVIFPFQPWSFPTITTGTDGFPGLLAPSTSPSRGTAPETAGGWTRVMNKNISKLKIHLRTDGILIEKMNTWLTSETGDFAWTKQDFTEEWRQKNNIPESLGVPLTGYSAGILWMISGRYIWRHWFGCPWNSSGTPTAIAGDFVFGLQKWTPFHAQRLHLSPCLISKFRFKISKAHIQNILCVLIIAGNQPTFFFPRFLQTCAHIQKISRKEPTLRTGILIYIYIYKRNIYIWLHVYIYMITCIYIYIPQKTWLVYHRVQ